MDNETLLKVLAKFFLGEFANDPDGVAEWVAQGDFTIDEVYEAAKIAADEGRPVPQHGSGP